MAKKPAARFKSSRNAEVTVWDNGDNGVGITITPPSFKGDDGVYKTTAFWASDLPGLAWSIRQAMEWCREREFRRQNGEKTERQPGEEE